MFWNFLVRRTRRGFSLDYAQLFCRVPWATVTRSPWSSRPFHLCRLWVRFILILLAKLFQDAEVTLTRPMDEKIPIINFQILPKAALRAKQFSNLKSQLSRFVILIFRILNLFGIWFLCFGISLSKGQAYYTSNKRCSGFANCNCFSALS